MLLRREENGKASLELSGARHVLIHRRMWPGYSIKKEPRTSLLGEWGEGNYLARSFQLVGRVGACHLACHMSPIQEHTAMAACANSVRDSSPPPRLLRLNRWDRHCLHLNFLFARGTTFSQTQVGGNYNDFVDKHRDTSAKAPQQPQPIHPTNFRQHVPTYGVYTDLTFLGRFERTLGSNIYHRKGCYELGGATICYARCTPYTRAMPPTTSVAVAEKVNTASPGQLAFADETEPASPSCQRHRAQWGDGYSGTGTMARGLLCEERAVWCGIWHMSVGYRTRASAHGVNFW